MTTKKKQLTDLPNIGKVLAERLIEAEIDSPEKLAALGSEQAFIRLKTIEPDSCFNKLCALEGAVQNIRWHQLAAERKEALKVFFQQVDH
ncbi:competence protein TfoX [Marinilabiliaceae bacterium JC017]|nr:competence protein TfoX [Marinilabiliaceae bacterium JC017]